MIIMLIIIIIYNEKYIYEDEVFVNFVKIFNI